MNLPKEEQRIYTILSKARTIKYEQALAINRDSTKKQKAHAVTALYKKGLIFYSKHKDYIMIHPKYKPDKRVEDAMWLVLRQITNIDPNQIYEPTLPSTLGYVKENKCYEIVCANNEKELREAIEKINVIYRENMYIDDESAIRYLIIIKHEEYINSMPKDIQFPYAFAIQRYARGLELLKEPEFEFLIPEEGEK